jgi:Uma2 family endonuclease
MGEALAKKNYTLEEYLILEESSVEKLEYHNGEIFSMAGGTLNHSLLSNNIGGALREGFKTKMKTCKTFNSDAKIAVSERKFMYADTFVVCGKIETFDKMHQAAKNPTLIVEVLSDSTSKYDREDKFRAYQKIDSFQEYVLVAQDQVSVEVFYKSPNADFWQYRTYSNVEDILVLNSLNISISLHEVYLNWEPQIEI